MLNLLTTITNFTAYFPIRTAYLNGDYLTAGIVGFTALSSAISHLFESHKHRMWGFGTSPRTSYLLNRMDVLGVGLTILRVVYLWYKSGLGLGLITGHPLLVNAGLLAFACNYLSERDPGYTYYLPLHCIWHLSIFLLLNHALQLIY